MGVSDGSPQRSGVLYLYSQFWQLARGNRHKLIGACALLLGAQLILLAAPLATFADADIPAVAA